MKAELRFAPAATSAANAFTIVPNTENSECVIRLLPNELVILKNEN